jgi:hypothetical protein
MDVKWPAIMDGDEILVCPSAQNSTVKSFGCPRILTLILSGKLGILLATWKA